MRSENTHETNNNVRFMLARFFGNRFAFVRNLIDARKAKIAQYELDLRLRTIREAFSDCVEMGHRTEAFALLMEIIASQTTNKERRAITHWLADLNFHFEHIAGSVKTPTGE